MDVCRGSSFADWGVQNIGRPLGFEGVLPLLGGHTEAFYNLTTQFMNEGKGAVRHKCLILPVLRVVETERLRLRLAVVFV